jgi:hypothetical protein
LAGAVAACAEPTLKATTAASRMWGFTVTALQMRR